MSSAKDPFVEVPAGATVFKPGDAADCMYIIESGQIEILRPTDDGDALTLGPGAFFGELALLEERPHAVAALAKTKSRLLRIERAAFAGVLRQNAEIALHIMRKLAMRLRRSEQRLQEALLGQAKTVPSPEAIDVVAPVVAPLPTSPVTVPAPIAPSPQISPASVQNWALRLVGGSGQMLSLDPASNEFLVGRPDPATGTTPEINLGPFDSSRTLSRRHAKILRDGGLYFVREEAGTTNGTFVNGERLKAGVAVPLKAGDKLRFGSVEVEVLVA